MRVDQNGELVTQYAKIFGRQDTHPLVVDLALYELFGPEWLAWDPDSVFLALERRLANPISQAARNRVYALGVVHANHAYWQDWRAFEVCNWALSGKQVDLVQATPLTTTVMLYGVRTSRWLDDKPRFSDEVQAYAAAVLLEDQFSLAPDELGFAQDRMFRERPFIQPRADLVRAALIARKPLAAPESDETDSVAVEVSRHQVLLAALDLVCSPDFVSGQAAKYGIPPEIITKVLHGGSA